MNNQRRKALEKIQDKLRDIYADIEMYRDEEQDAFDNLPESIQYSERGEKMEEAISQLDEAYDAIDTAVEAISEAIQ